MWRCLVEENVRAGRVSNVGCGSDLITCTTPCGHVFDF